MTDHQIPSYPKVWAVGAPAVEQMFLHGDEIVVQEKVDGSQISFGKVDGELVMRSKGQPLYAENPDGMFKAGIDAITAIADALPDNTIFRGEYLNRPRHNTLAYDRIPRNHIVLFDVQTLNPETLVWTYGDGLSLNLWADDLDFETVPELRREVFEKVTELTDLLEIESFLGGPKIEGFVCKNYARLTRLGDQMFGKYVSPEFKEKHVKDWKNRNPKGVDFVARLADEYATPARFRKGVEFLRDAGQLTGEPRDIGPLMKRLAEDFVAEHEADVRDRLWNHFSKDIIRGAGRGAPEWYKAQLLEHAFRPFHHDHMNPDGTEQEPAKPFLVEIIEANGDRQSGWEQRWWCEPPAEGVPYRVVRETWHADMSVRNVQEISLIAEELADSEELAGV